MTKRRSRCEEPLFPEIAPEEKGRYAHRGDSTPWTPAHDAVLFAAITACKNRSAYGEMMPWLLRALGHEPKYGDKAIPPPRKHLSNCLRAVELRAVTKCLGGMGGWAPPAVMGFPVQFGHDGEPLSWSERVKLIRPYARRTSGKYTCHAIDFGQFMQCLGRTDKKPVLAYMQTIAANPRFVDEEEEGRPPVHKGNVAALHEAVFWLDYYLDNDVAGESPEPWKKCIWGLLNE